MSSPGIREDKVRELLRIVGAENLESLSRVDAAIALGRLLTVNVTEARPSVHEITKEVRSALELVVRNPLRESDDDVVKVALYRAPPFESDVLNEAYRLLLMKLLRETLRVAKGLNPMWRKRLVNNTIENIYIVAVEERSYRNKIFDVLLKHETRR